MDKDTLQIVIMVVGFAITIITFLLKFPSRDEMNRRFDDMNKWLDDMNKWLDDMNQRITDMNKRFDERITDINQRLIDLNADVRNIYHILIQGKPNESENDD